MPDTAPLSDKLEADFGATAAGDAQTTIIGEAPYDLTVTGVSVVFEANVTGATATARTLEVIDKGTDGNGTTVVATLALTTGVDALDFDEKAFTLSAVAGALEVAAGAQLALVETVATTGTANPGGRITVEFTRGQD